jgi:hypothetical protein
MRALSRSIRPLLLAMLIAAACCPPQCVSAGDRVARPAAQATAREPAAGAIEPALGETLLQWGEELGVIEPTNEGGGGRRRIVKLLILAFILGAQ